MWQKEEGHFEVQNIDGGEVSLKDYDGKVVLIVNVASKWGRRLDETSFESFNILRKLRKIYHLSFIFYHLLSWLLSFLSLNFSLKHEVQVSRSPTTLNCAPFARVRFALDRCSLYQKYKARGFEVLAFPCNQFGGQEPGSNAEVKALRLKAECPSSKKTIRKMI